jgi:hypothetical protein
MVERHGDSNPLQHRRKEVWLVCPLDAPMEEFDALPVGSLLKADACEPIVRPDVSGPPADGLFKERGGACRFDLQFEDAPPCPGLGALRVVLRRSLEFTPGLILLARKKRAIARVIRLDSTTAGRMSASRSTSSCLSPVRSAWTTSSYSIRACAPSLLRAALKSA